jgi:hexosaminidase
MQDPLLLIPVPRRMLRLEGIYTLTVGRSIYLDHEEPQALLFMGRRCQAALQARCGIQWQIAGSPLTPSHPPGLVLRVDPDLSIREQGYRLSIKEQGISIEARDEAGAFYGVCTLLQVIDLRGRNLPCLEISDWPDFAARGVMLDISRGRVPTMQTLFDLVDLLASWKINQLQLYTEHAFAYSQHQKIWEKVTPITGPEVVELDRFCRERYIELVPNQQSFGHLAPWLNHPDYKHLAEVEDGFMTPWGYRSGSFSLSPIDPGSLDFLRSLYAELLPNFSSRMFNVGCDETWDVGQGRSKEACERVGKGRVYLDFLLQVYQEVRSFGKTPQFWGDILVEYPDLIPELPKDILILEWGYEADHPFDLHGAQLAAGDIPFYVCPGTSSWCSISGRTDNALVNLRSAAENGKKHGAIGYLNTDWGDYGHWQAWPVSCLGLMVGAAYAWALESSRAMDVARTLSWHAFRDASGGTGKLARDLGNIYRETGVEPHNSSILFWILQWTLEAIRAYEGLSTEVLKRALDATEAAACRLAASKMDRPDAELVRLEFGYTVRMLKHACRRGMLAFENDPNLRAELDRDLTLLIDELRQAWLQRNRPGGLDKGIALLEKLRQDYKETA